MVSKAIGCRFDSCLPCQNYERMVDMDITVRLLDVALYVLFLYIGHLLANRKRVEPQQELTYIVPHVTVDKESGTKKKEDEEELNSFFN